MAHIYKKDGDFDDPKNALPSIAQAVAKFVFEHGKFDAPETWREEDALLSAPIYKMGSYRGRILAVSGIREGADLFSSDNLTVVCEIRQFEGGGFVVTVTRGHILSGKVVMHRWLVSKDNMGIGSVLKAMWHQR